MNKRSDVLLYHSKRPLKKVMFCSCQNIYVKLIVLLTDVFLLEIAVESTVGWEFLFVQLVKTLEVFVQKNSSPSLIPYAFKHFEYDVPGAK